MATINTAKLKRTYEISLWTLQDSFIAVLGDSSSLYKGYITDPTMQLSNDGTLELDFTLPMYIDNGITRVKSNIWAQMTDAVTIAGMRKIKVIFNKGTSNLAIYELIITKVTDTHELDKPACSIHCEGLAFHELGKIGYKISLSLDNYYADEEEEWDRIAESTDNINTLITSTVLPTIDYWAKKIGLVPYSEAGTTIDSTIWYYRVTMDWSGFSSGYARSSSKVYEEAYVATYDDSTLEPTGYASYKEKLRFVEASESNIYNLTLEIAKTFGVYCKYDYEHDDNFHITARIVTFYNNFIDEKNRLEFTYPYTTKSITRENDCTDLITKMYVNTIESDLSSTGLVTIMDNPVNPTGEDYLLNFDYLYAIGTISDEQYAYISEFSKKVRSLNKTILAWQDYQIKRETVEVTYSALLAVLENSITEDTEQISTYTDLKNAITTNGIISRTDGLGLELFTVSGTITFPTEDKGVVASSIKLWTDDTKSTRITLSDKTIILDSTNKKYAQGISGLGEYNSVYAEYKFHPELYYLEVINTFVTRLANDNKKYNALYKKILTLDTQEENAEAKIATAQTSKEELLKKFERTMGPALREGNWTPEDYTHIAAASYLYLGNLLLSSSTWETTDKIKVISAASTGPSASLIWDSYLGYNEIDDKIVNLEGLNEYYYIAKLNTTMLSELSQFYADESKGGLAFGLVWWKKNWTEPDDYYPSPVIKIYTIGSNCECAFIYNKNDGTIFPALILTDLEDVTLEDLNGDSLVELYWCGVNAEYDTTNNVFNISRTHRYTTSESYPEYYKLSKASIIFKADSNYVVHALRYRIRDYTLFTDENNLKVWFGSTALTNYDDYSVDLIVPETTADEDKGYDITFKPLSLFKLWKSNRKCKVKYNCSLLSTAIYLDAVEILKENAYPKVTYNIDPNLLYEDFFKTDYLSLNKIAFINDNELEFNLVLGYISSISLNLDRPWEDSVEVKNYKNKFEDIFSTIVAQTESMEKSEAIITNIGNTINFDGSISATNLSSTLTSIVLRYSISGGGSLSIDKTSGILCETTGGAMMWKPSGFYIANTMNEANKWNWSKAISASGINADMLRSGSLSLDKVKLTSTSENKTLSISSSGIISKKTTTTVEVGNISTTTVDYTLTINAGKMSSTSGTTSASMSIYDGILKSGGLTITNGTLTVGNLSISSNTLNCDDLSIVSGKITSDTLSIDSGTFKSSDLTIVNGIITSNSLTINNGILTSTNSATSTSLIISNANLTSGSLTLNNGLLTSNTLTLNNGLLTSNTLTLTNGLLTSDTLTLNNGLLTSGSMTLNNGTLTSNTLTIATGQLTSGTFTLNNGVLTSGVLTINNGIITLVDNTNENNTYNAVQLLPAANLVAARLLVASKDNLYIGAQDIQTYILDNSSTTINVWWQSVSSIPITTINIGLDNSGRTVYITTDSLRLGLSTNPIFNYSYTNLALSLNVGTMFTYNIDSNGVLTGSIAGWDLTTSGLVSKDANSNIISLLIPNNFNFNNFLFVNSTGIRAKEVSIEANDNDEHIITFINTGENAVNYLLKIDGEGLHYSLDEGTTWHTVAIVEETEPDPGTGGETPDPNPDPNPGEIEPEINPEEP